MLVLNQGRTRLENSKELVSPEIVRQKRLSSASVRRKFCRKSDCL